MDSRIAPWELDCLEVAPVATPGEHFGMRKIGLAAMFVLASGSPAVAGGQEGNIGVGAEFGLNGLTGGISVNYDAGKFHTGGFVGMFDDGGNDDTDYTIGARFFYHLHSTAMSDFGVGGLFGYFSDDDGNGMTDRESVVFLEPSFQIRLFVASNVALSFNAGISIALIDGDGFALGGGGLNTGVFGGLGAGNQIGIVNASAGIHYYFF